jgi:hypothetical protein
MSKNASSGCPGLTPVTANFSITSIKKYSRKIYGIPLDNRFYLTI